MKRFLTILMMVLLAQVAMAQNPQKLSYQAVVRNSNNELVVNESVTVKVNITDPTGATTYYSEQHAVRTNRNGLLTLMIGEGTPISGKMSDVVWYQAAIKTTITVNGQNIENITEVNAVPYAIHADSARTVNREVLDEEIRKITDITAAKLRSEISDNKHAIIDTAASLRSAIEALAADDAWKDADIVINNRITADSTALHNALIDTAAALRAAMPTVNDGKITIKRNDVEVDNFTVNTATDKAINIEVPTTVAELEDAANYATVAKVKADSTALAQQIADANAGVNTLRDSVKTNMTNIADNTSNIATNTTNIEKNKQAIIDTAANIRGALVDTAAALREAIAEANDGWKAADVVINNRITTDSTALHKAIKDSTVAVRSALVDTAAALREALPTVNDGTITIKRNDVEVDNFTVNTATDKAINIEVPTTVAELEDAANYATVAKVKADSTALAQQIADANAGVNTLRDSVKTNMTNIADNTSNIATNTTNIEKNKQAIIDTAANIRAEMAAVGATIGNGTISIKRNDVEVDNFTVNTATDKAINIAVPTTVAELEDAANYATVAKVKADSTALAQQIADANAGVNTLRDSVKTNMANIADNTSNIATNTTNIEKNKQAIIDTAANIRGALVDTAAALREAIAEANDGWKAADVVINNRITTDSTALHKAIKDSTVAVRGALVDTAAALREAIAEANDGWKAADVVINNRITTDSTALHKAIKDSTIAVRSALVDTAAALRAAMPTVNDAKLTVNVIDVDGTTTTEFTANSTADKNVTVDLTSYAKQQALVDSMKRVDKRIKADSLELRAKYEELKARANDSIAKYRNLMNIAQQTLITMGIQVGKNTTGVAENKQAIIDTAAHIRAEMAAVGATIGNGTITINKNNTKVDDFTLNSNENKAINIEVPTKVTDLEDADNYATVTKVQADSQALADKMHADSLALAQQIKNSNGNIQTLRDSVKNDMQALADFKVKVQTDSTTLHKAVKDSTVAVRSALVDTAAALREAIADANDAWKDADVVINNRITKDSTDLHKALVDSMKRVDARIKADSLEVKALYDAAVANVTAMAAKEKADSLLLAKRIDALDTDLSKQDGQLTIKQNGEVKGVFNQEDDLEVDIDLSDYATLAKVKADSTALAKKGNDTIQYFKDKTLGYLKQINGMSGSTSLSEAAPEVVAKINEALTTLALVKPMLPQLMLIPNRLQTVETKLATIEEGAEVNVQADWSETNTESDAYIQNKPTKVSQFENDAAYITSAAVPTKVSELANDAAYITKDVDNLTNYTKSSDLAAVATSGNYNDLSDKPAINNATLTIKQDDATLGTFTANAENAVVVTIPTPAEQVQADWSQADNTKADFIKNKPENLVQDANYVHTDNNYTTAEKDKLAGLATVATSGSYNDLSDQPAINNATLTIKQGETTLGTFTANAESATVVTIPTPAEQVQADWSQADNTKADFIKNKPENLVQDANYVHTDNNYTTAEKTKLEGIAAGAEVNVQADWNAIEGDAVILNKPTIPDAQVNADWNATSGVAQILNKPTLATVATSGSYNDLSDKPAINNATLTIKQGETTLGTFTANAENAVVVTIPTPAEQVQADWNQATTTATDYIKNKPTKLTDFTNDGDFVRDANYVHTDNNYTTAEKTKLEGIAAGAEVNVQADWNATEGDAVILNKPTIPDAANNAIITIQKNGTAVDNFSVNASENKSINIVVPTKVTDLEDASNYLTEHQDISGKVDKVEGKGLSTNDYTTAEKTKLEGIAAGAEVNVQADWNATTGDAVILNKPTIPDAQVNADWNATSGVSQILNKPTLATVATSGKYSDLTDIPADIVTDANYVHTDNNYTTAEKNLLADLATRVAKLEAEIGTQGQQNYTATAGQTSFALTKEAKSGFVARMYINGVMVGGTNNSVLSVSGTTVTYNATNNGGYALKAGDVVTIVYWY